MRANRTTPGRQRRSREGDCGSLLNMRRVDEQSHKDEMRAALRGDFERLRARRDDPEALHAAGERAGPTGEPDASDDDARAPQPPQPIESWLARLLGR